MEVALVAVALVSIAVLYRVWPYALDETLVRLGLHMTESAIAERPIVGSLLGFAYWLAVGFLGLWVPIAVAIMITWVV